MADDYENMTMEEYFTSRANSVQEVWFELDFYNRLSLLTVMKYVKWWNMLLLMVVVKKVPLKATAALFTNTWMVGLSLITCFSVALSKVSSDKSIE